MIKISLLNKKALYQRLDIIAFLIIQIILPYLLSHMNLLGPIGVKFFGIFVFFVSCVAFLITENSAYYNQLVRFQHIRKVQQASHVYLHKIDKHKKHTRKVIPLVQQQIQLQDSSKQKIYTFQYQKITFVFNEEKNLFLKVKPSLKGTVKHLWENKDSFYENEIMKKLMDKNTLVFPLPSFWHLLKEQLTDPLNFFQFFTSSLWLFDDNIIFPLFTIAMLFVTNAQVCIQRLQTILGLRNLTTKDYKVTVKRDGKFIEISSADLYPGDLVVIQSSAQLQATESSKTQKYQFIKEIRAVLPLGYLLPPVLIEKFIKKEKTNDEPVISCDMLIINGTVAVDESILTGESLPQIKSPIEKRQQNSLFNQNEFRNSIIYAGTNLLSVNTEGSSDKALGLVLKTGFHTTKGKLARTVLYSEENQKEFQKDSFFLLILLLIVSIISSVYVLIKGLQDQERNKNKLFLRCITIITNVVPTELPMVMNMAINTSLQYLKRKRIFCTEPHWMLLAGKIQTCVFDKTGTLTQEDLKMHGIMLYQGAQKDMKDIEPNEKGSLILPENIEAVLGGCHQLFEHGGKLQGDLVEMLFFQQTSWKYSYEEKKAYLSTQSSKNIKQIKVFQFNSDLKRMSVLIKLNGFNSLQKSFLVTKGAPEIIFELLNKKDEQLKNQYTLLAKKGYRVLALAIKETLNAETEQREELEKDLTFVGFLVLVNRLKNDTIENIQILHKANKKIVMLTGDHLLTSIATFEELWLNNKPFLSIQYKDKDIQFFDMENNQIQIDLQKEKDIQKFNLGIDGQNLEHLSLYNQSLVHQLKVIARVCPKSKEKVIEILKTHSWVLMCGDGTNDVGALKMAHVGIALVGKKDEPTWEVKQQRKKLKQEELRKALMERRKTNMDLINFDQEDLDFKLGDASIAAPFTNKHSNSLKCVVTILRQGVATLTSSIQSYKIVTLASLVNAYSLSFLHMENLKFSDMQNTIIGIYGVYLYYMLSAGKPVKELYHKTPQTNIFNKYFWFSLVGQVAMIFTQMVVLMRFAKKYAPLKQRDIDHEEGFQPTFISSVMYLNELSSLFCINIFNFEGRPFMKSLSEYKGHFKLMLIPLIILALLIFEYPVNISSTFQATFESTHPNTQVILFCIIFGFIVLQFAWSRAIKYWQHGRLFKLI